MRKSRLIWCAYLTVGLIVSGLTWIALTSICTGSGSRWLCTWLGQFYASVSVGAALLFAFDKLNAGGRGAARVPELLLLLFGAAGAAPVLVGLAVLIRHKVRSRKFQIALLGESLAHLLLLSAYR